MREAVWALLAAVLLFTGLAPSVAAGHGEDDGCTTVHYAITPETGGAVSSCPGSNQLPGLSPSNLPGPDLPAPDAPIDQGTEEACPEYGYVIGSDDDQVWFCLTLETRWPSTGPGDLISVPELGNLTPGEPGAGDEGCPEAARDGFVVEMGETRAGICIILIYEPFEIDPHDSRISTRADDCEIPEGGTDPAVRYNEGGVAFCLVTVFETGTVDPPEQPPGPEDPPVGVDDEPCQPRATDPTVHIFDGFVRVCVDAGIGDY